MKKCSSCNKLKDELLFGHKRNQCKKCRLKVSNKWRNTRKEKDINYYLNLLLHKAKLRNYSFDLSLKFLINLWNKQQGLCALSGIMMTHEGAPIFTNVSIDRKNSDKGYTKNNVQLVCVGINKMKSNLTDRKFIEICTTIVRNK